MGPHPLVHDLAHGRLNGTLLVTEQVVNGEQLEGSDGRRGHG